MLSLIFQPFGAVLRDDHVVRKVHPMPITGQNHSFHPDAMLSL